MKLVADESLDGPIVERLRADGHSVLFVAELRPGIADTEVLAMARSAGAVLVTADKDFGDLVFWRGLSHSGILLVRLAGVAQDGKAAMVSEAVREHGEKMVDRFSVLTRDALRIR